MILRMVWGVKVMLMRGVIAWVGLLGKSWALEGRGCNWSDGFIGAGGVGGVQCGGVAGIGKMGSVCICTWLCGVLS